VSVTAAAPDGAGTAHRVDFWPACGWRHLQRTAEGWHCPTGAYWGHFLARPELACVDESCAAERALHGLLTRDPLRTVAAREIDAIADADLRQNLRHFLAWRDEATAAGSVEAWLLGLWRSGSIALPSLFIDLAVQAVLRGLLDDGEADAAGSAGSAVTDAFTARAAEMLFRAQRLSMHEGRLLAGDRDTLDLQHRTQGFGQLGALLAEAGAPLKALQVQVLRADNQRDYWAEAERAPTPAAPLPMHSFLLDLTHELRQDLGHGLTFHLRATHSGLGALAGVLERWVQHLLGVRVRIEPLQRIDDPQWRWHIGLDASASALLDDLYRGEAVDPNRTQRLVSLFRLVFVEPRAMRPDVAGKPVYLGMMMNEQRELKLKPQNLLLNLPLAGSS
jgi:hypothetical protein